MVLCFWKLICVFVSIHHLSLAWGTSWGTYPRNTLAIAQDFSIATEGESFISDCVTEEGDLMHPGWYFTRDKWIRDKMDESCKKLI